MGRGKTAVFTLGLSCKKGRRWKFSLMELLITTSIIIILAAIVMPGLGKARQRAFQTQCSGILNQLGKACQMYADDHEDRFPVYKDGESPEVRMWYSLVSSAGKTSMLGAYMGHPNTSSSRNAPPIGVLTSGFHNKYVCPAETLKGDDATGTYGYNQHLYSESLTGYSDPVQKSAARERSTLRRAWRMPSASLFVGEILHSGEKFINYYDPVNDAGNANGKFMRFRHISAANVLYGDSHVAPVSYTPANWRPNSWRKPFWFPVWR